MNENFSMQFRIRKVVCPRKSKLKTVKNTTIQNLLSVPMNKAVKNFVQHLINFKIVAS